MNNENITEALEGVDLEPLTDVLKEQVEVLLDNDPKYFQFVNKNPIVSNLKAIIEMIEKSTE